MPLSASSASFLPSLSSFGNKFAGNYPQICFHEIFFFFNILKAVSSVSAFSGRDELNSQSTMLRGKSTVKVRIIAHKGKK